MILQLLIALLAAPGALWFCFGWEVGLCASLMIWGAYGIGFQQASKAWAAAEDEKRRDREMLT